MKTVAQIIEAVYGTPSVAATVLNVGRSSISNWKSWGYFPGWTLPQILSAATENGVALEYGDIPLKKQAA